MFCSNVIAAPLNNIVYLQPLPTNGLSTEAIINMIKGETSCTVAPFDKKSNVFCVVDNHGPLGRWTGKVA